MRSLVRVGLVLLGVLAMAPRAQATPFLQLDIEGGVYDTGTESIITPDGAFTLYALLTPQGQQVVDFNETYYVSVALTPQTNTAGSYGSFDFGTTTVDVTSDMVYGVPPVEVLSSLQGQDALDLGTHDVYPTYFQEFAFQFSAANQVEEYNTQDDPGGPSPGTGTYVVAFNIDATALAQGYNLHFDLYNTTVRNCTSGCPDVDRDDFAPFSHDAETRRVPEPATLTLVGLGFVGLAASSRRRRQQLPQ